MAILAPFQPRFGAGVVVSPAAASANSAIGKGNKQIHFANLTSAVCYVSIGYSGLTASTADFPIPGNTTRVLSKDEDMTHVAYISAAGTTLHIIPGEGWI